MSEQKKKMYVGCALAYAPEEFKQDIVELKKKLSGDVEVLEFFSADYTVGLPKDVYLHDKKMVEDCDVMLAVCDLPSLGLGFEIATALQLGKQVLAVAHEDTKVSRMIVGIDDSCFLFLRYKDFSEIPELVKKHLI